MPQYFWKHQRGRVASIEQTGHGTYGPVMSALIHNAIFQAFPASLQMSPDL